MEQKTEVKVRIASYAVSRKFEYDEKEYFFSSYPDLYKEIIARYFIMSYPNKIIVKIGTKKFVVEEVFFQYPDIEEHFELAMRNTIIAQKKVAEKTRNCRIEFRLSTVEKELIEYRAKQFLMSVSDYSRQMLVYGKVLKISQEEKRILNGIGININQIAKKVNLGYIPENLLIDFEHTLKEIKKFYL